MSPRTLKHSPLSFAPAPTILCAGFLQNEWRVWPRLHGWGQYTLCHRGPMLTSLALRLAQVQDVPWYLCVCSFLSQGVDKCFSGPPTPTSLGPGPSLNGEPHREAASLRGAAGGTWWGASSHRPGITLGAPCPSNLMIKCTWHLKLGQLTVCQDCLQ